MRTDFTPEMIEILNNSIDVNCNFYAEITESKILGLWVHDFYLYFDIDHENVELFFKEHEGDYRAKYQGKYVLFSSLFDLSDEERSQFDAEIQAAKAKELEYVLGAAI